jgi:hypothetical protein
VKSISVGGSEFIGTYELKENPSLILMGAERQSSGEEVGQSDRPHQLNRSLLELKGMIH